MKSIRRTGSGPVRRIIALFAAATLICAAACPAFAVSSSPKEEVIYVKTDASGHTKSVNAVNIFGAGSITDYGDYSSVRLMNSNADITLDGDTVTFSTDGARVYYQGTMDPATEIPWDISIRYYIDGVEVTPEEAAGASGTLQIRFSAIKNPDCSSVYFDNYALQATFLLDTEKCSIVSAPDATIANVGSGKQLTYTILPGKGIDTAIVAQVRDFEMEAVSINGIALNLNIDIDDDELMDKVTQLMTAVRKLNNGAAELADGASDAESGAESLLSGSKNLYSGVDDLDEGVKNLRSGILKIQTGLETLDSQSDSLTKGSAQVKAALGNIQTALEGVSTGEELTAQLTQLDTLKAGNTSAAEKLSDLATALENAQAPSISDESLSNTIGLLKSIAASGTDEQKAQAAAALKELEDLKTAVGNAGNQLSTLKGYASSLSGAAALLNQDNAAIDQLESLLTSVASLKTGIDALVEQYETLDAGITNYTDGLGDIIDGYSSLVSGVSSLVSGSSDLLEGAGALKSGTADLYEGVADLCSGAEKLANNMNKLNSKTSGLDEQVQDEIDEILASLGGDDFDAVSFTSEKNTNVKSVQFVIKTDPIEIGSAEEAEEAPEETGQSFWDKLTGLFD